MEEKSGLLSNLFDKKTVEILKKLLLKKDVFYLRDLSRDTNVSLATTFRIVQKLMALGLVIKEQHDKFTFYKIQRDVPIFSELSSLVLGDMSDPVQIIKKELKDQFGPTFKIYQSRDKDKKIFVVSELVKPQTIEELSIKLQNQTGAKPSMMLVTTSFFEQMHTMGLINKEKLVIM